MISRRRFTAAAAATIATGPFIRRAGAQTKTVIRYGDVLPANYPSVVALEAAGREIAAKTGGRLEMQVFPASQLGTQRDMIEALGSNALQLYTDGAATFGSWVPAISVLEAPYVWRDAAHMSKGMASVDGRNLTDALVKTRGMRILDTIYYGTRQLTTAGKAVKEPKDMVGFKLRVPPVDVFNAMAEAWVATLKTELVAGRLLSYEQLEHETLAWIGFYNTERLHESLGDRPPTEVEILHARRYVLTPSPDQ